ncbi:uncharacterized protein [Triticum aestivum]|uniref:uncharacterized protein n=1 Tax=Triticum aestivum TaxID=4565 RepID=UPI001D015F10|nr:uncharacterized protein LOC123142271 [Triticum aestivum]
MENRNKTDLKRKRLDDGTEQEQEAAIKETCQVLKEMESEVQNLRDDNNLLRDELLGKDRQLAETDTLLVDREHQLSKTQTLLVDTEQQLAAQTLLVDTKEFETETVLSSFTCKDPITKERVYGRHNLGSWLSEFKTEQDLEHGVRKELLAKIRRYYDQVNIVDEGFCFGLLDPVSNIVVAEAIAQSKLLVVDEEDKAELAEDSHGRQRPILRCIFERSLDGLIAFLVALFPYLPYYRAEWYLNKANLDPLVAANLIIKHRGMEQTFRFLSDTTVAAVGMALRCAAAAALHPNPRKFALGWKLLSPFLCKINTLLSPPYAAQDPGLLIDIQELLQQPEPPALFVLEEAWRLASKRTGSNLNHPEMQVPLLPTLKHLLLTTIHGYYLEALACLPKDKLRGSHQYHYSLLHAGHCYGPLDPVSNIIVNTLWYAQAYPLKLEKKIDIEVISTKALLRIALRSLYGLVSFLCTRHPTLTVGEAMQQLQLAGAYLQKADDPSHHDGGVEQEAYMAAAKAAHHAKPLEQAHFLGPSNSMLKGCLELLNQNEDAKVRTLILGHFQTNSKPAQETKNTNVLGPWAYRDVMRMIDNFWYQHTSVVGMVKSAIEMYNKKSQVQPSYEVHVICGVNEHVGGRADLMRPFQHISHCSHINFLATQVAGTPKLFFAECRNVGSKEAVLCCPVAMPLPGSEQVRCLYCESRGMTIVHPTKERFLGRDREFEEMFRGEGDTTVDVTSDSYYITSYLHNLEEDWIFGDYSCDSELQEEGRLFDIN